MNANIYLAGPYHAVAGGGALGDVDLIHVPVPEPSTLLLLGLSLAGLLVWRPRRG